MKKVLSAVLCILMVFCALPFGTAFAESGDVLRFNTDRSFKILVLADCQDDKTPDSSMMEAIDQLLDLNEPDLVIFTGDNVVEDKLSEFTQGLKALLQSVVGRNIPYAFTFGNHDDEYGVSKDEQYGVYKTIGRCLTTDPVPSLTGLGTCNIPILHSDSDKMAFNLWIVDSNTYDKTNGGYDHVHEDQLDWLRQKQSEITEAEGGIVNSLIFQHIIVPEITSCLTQSASGSWTYNGTKYALSFNENGSGTLFEHPCPPTVNGGEYETAVGMGGVLGIVTGHDHNNDFIAKPGSVDLIQVGGMSYNSYGDARVRGASLITLNEEDTSVYSVRRFLNTRLFAGDYGYPEKEPVYVQEIGGRTYISEICAAADKSDSTARSTLTQAGYTPILFDLNKGAGGDYIYFGYKTTTDITQAITGFRFISSPDSSSHPSTKEFRGVSYSLASSIDLNKGAGGDYIFLYYTKQANAGAPITELLVNETANTAGYTPAGTFEGVTAADLNKNAKGAYIYLQSRSSLPVLEAADFIAAYEAAADADPAGKAPERAEALALALTDAKTVYESLVSNYRTPAAQSTLDLYTAALTEALDFLDIPHSHTPGDTVIENDIPSTCAKAGSYDEVVYCTVCKEEISRTKIDKTLAAHTPGDTVTENDIPSTCAKAGSYDEVVYCTVCKEEISRTKIDKILAAHTPGEVVTENEKEGTCVTKGTCDKVVYCTVCGAELSRTKTDTVYGGHQPGGKVTENAVPATCTDKGVYDEVVYCALCRAELSRQSVTTDRAAHKDDNGDAYCDDCGADMSVSCSHLCHKTGLLGFIWKIINFFNKLFQINKYCSCGAAHW